MSINIRAFESGDSEAVLALNKASVQFLSPMDAERLQLLRAHSALFWVAENNEGVVGFLLAFTHGAAYDSPNYRWFNARLQRFLYIDRIVLSAQVRGQGLGQQFYRELTDWAKAQQLVWLAAEIDIAPSNPPSLQFHQQQGFITAAEQAVGNKRVSLQIKSL
ncbi:GNAT family N-acetyltransferase [Simiduia aestuariiviva]|uniref:N-acetyltransferase domain-containing protein n=1 Tax=Simiduia aestuariiviva TaxID=1510459 RepID=A0A839UX28_9GAMM|nr:GNAT family N-acetyltransferase [Simiduia aestuariiviva]MBB3169917.1 hypothetical protein [Simiduia aestuariiviva]